MQQTWHKISNRALTSQSVKLIRKIRQPLTMQSPRDTGRVINTAWHGSTQWCETAEGVSVLNRGEREGGHAARPSRAVSCTSLSDGVPYRINYPESAAPAKHSSSSSHFSFVTTKLIFPNKEGTSSGTPASVIGSVTETLGFSNCRWSPWCWGRWEEHPCALSTPS